MSFPLYNKKSEAVEGAKHSVAVNEMMYIASDGRLKDIHNNDWFVAKVKGTSGFLQGSKNPNKIMYANTGLNRGSSKEKAKIQLNRMGLTVLDVERIPKLKPVEIRKRALPFAKHLKRDAQRKAVTSLGCRPGQVWMDGKCKKLKG